MSSSIDSSIVVAALKKDESHHRQCRDLLWRQPQLHLLSHALAETFSSLTGGRLGGRLSPGDAARALVSMPISRIAAIVLSTEEMLLSFQQAEARGIRGGAIYDYLHLVAARKAGAQRLYTLNISDFQSFHRSGDPEIVHP